MKLYLTPPGENFLIPELKLNIVEDKQQRCIGKIDTEERLWTRLWLNWNSVTKNRGPNNERGSLKAQDIAVGDHNFRSNLAESTWASCSTWIHINITMGVALGSWDYFVKLVDGPLHLLLRHQRQCNPHQRRYSGVSKPNHHIHTV